MTDDERYRIIGQVVSNHEEAKKILAALLAKAQTLGVMLQDVSKVLRQEGEFGPTLADDQFLVKERHGQARKHVASAWPTLAGVQALLAEIQATRDEIATLERQRRELGISS